uniref:EGF-like domain-containing protein n=1 Tax=Mesocestoides corti TaxID=53468 RepID=A0A5K3EJP5_MESCO
MILGIFLFVFLLCPAFSSSSTLFEKDCSRFGGRVLKHQCVLSSHLNETIIGIDLSNSNLSRLPDSVYSKDLLFLYIFGNPEMKPLESLCSCTSLTRLLLDSAAKCPGGHYSWNSTDSLLNGTIRVCENQLDFCRTSSRDLSCPSNSACVFNGPGCFNCLCLSDYFGFRCLSHGTFPTIIFVLSTLGVMIVICGLLLLYRLTGRQAAYQEVPSQEI